MTSTETTGQGLHTMEAPEPRIPGILTNQTATSLRSSVQGEANEPLAPPVVPAATAPRALPDPLRFPQKVSELRSGQLQAPESGSDRTCVLPKGLTFTGEAHYPCDVRIDGVVDGKITAEPDRTITVESEGKFKGSLKATNVRIEGSADGDITATGGLASFGAKSVCKGHITYGRLKIAEGADVEASMKKLAA